MAESENVSNESVSAKIDRYAQGVSIPTGIDMPKRLQAALIEVRRMQSHHWELIGVVQGIIDALRENELSEPIEVIKNDLMNLGINPESHMPPGAGDAAFYKDVG